MEITKIRSVLLGLAVLSPLHASSLYIVPTFDSSITGDPSATAIEGSIDAAISAIEGAITSPHNITVSIYFTEGGGLGESLTTEYEVSYLDFYNALEAAATQPNQLTALASLGTAPTSETSGNPVNGNDQVVITSAEARNLGFNAPGIIAPNSNINDATGGGTYDSEIALNTSITSPPNGLSGYYGLQAVATHEIDEALGIGGTGSTLGGDPSGPVGDLDLFRYSAPGVRSYSTVNTTSPYSYFSIDGGNTVLSYFNQTAGADYADWLSDPIPNGFSPQVQDAYGTPGADPALGANELTAFNAIGYDVTVPEPGTISSLFVGFPILAGLAYRRRARSIHA